MLSLVSAGWFNFKSTGKATVKQTDRNNAPTNNRGIFSWFSRNKAVKVEVKCKDSDVTMEYPNGVNIYQAGVTKGYDDETGNFGVFSDICLNVNRIKEYHCANKSDGTQIVKFEYEKCPNGCVNGVCTTGTTGEVTYAGVLDMFGDCNMNSFSSTPYENGKEYCAIRNARCLIGMGQMDLYIREDISGDFSLSGQQIISTSTLFDCEEAFSDIFDISSGSGFEIASEHYQVACCSAPN